MKTSDAAETEELPPRHTYRIGCGLIFMCAVERCDGERLSSGADAQMAALMSRRG